MENKQNIKLAKGVLILSAFLFGGYHEFVSGILTVILSAGLLIFDRKEQDLGQYRTLPVYVMLLILIGSIGSIFTAADSGMAVIGVIKYMPLLPAALLFSKMTREEREETICILPYVNSAILAVSLFSLLHPSWSEYFFHGERLGGTFQYSNTMALFFLIGIYCVEEREKRNLRSCALLVAQILGIFFTGSRSVFIFLVVYMLYATWKKKDYRIFNIGIMTAAMISGIFVVLQTGNMQNIGRFLTISLNNSTFLGRLLYWQDALPLAISHPLGTGYMGSFYMQGQIQTGVYTTRLLHNSLLQLLIDFGWIPAVAVIVLILSSFFSKEHSRFLKGILLLVIFHSLLDFDLQYMAMGFLFLLAADYKKTGSGKALAKKNQKGVLRAGAVSMLLVSACFLVPLLAEYGDNHELAVKLYPHYTEPLIDLLWQSSSQEEGERLADQILEQNSYCYQAYDAKALAALNKKDYEDVVRYKKLAIANNPYEIIEYIDYISLLSEIIYRCNEEGEMEQMAVYIKEIKEIPQMLQDVRNRTSLLGWKIQDKPELELPEEYKEYVQAFQ